MYLPKRYSVISPQQDSEREAYIHQVRSILQMRVAYTVGIAGLLPTMVAAIPTQISTTQTKAPPTLARFRDGVRLGVLGIRDGTKESPVWDVKGQRVDPASIPNKGHFASPIRTVVVNVVLDGITVTDQQVQTIPNTHFFKLGKLPVSSCGAMFDCGPVSFQAVKGSEMPQPIYSQKTGRMSYELGFQIPASMAKADLEIGRGVGKFSRVGVWTEGKHDFELEIKPLKGQSNEPSIVMTPKNSNKFTTLTLTLPKAVVDKDWRVTLVGKDGKPQSLRMNPPMPDFKHPGQYTSMGFMQGSPDQLREVDLDARNLQWVKVRDVAMTPKPGA